MKSEEIKASHVTRKILRVLLFSLFTFHFSLAQNVQPQVGERIAVRGGLAEVAARNRAGVDLARMTPDSLYRYMRAIDSLRADGVRFDRARTDSIVTSLIDRSSPTGDTLDARAQTRLIEQRKTLPLNPPTVRRFMADPAFIARYIDGGADTLVTKFPTYAGLSKRERRRLAREDSTAYRYNKIFRDSMPLSRTVAISLGVPGFAQFYNEDYLKIPVIWGGMAAGIGLFAAQSKAWRPLKKRYDDLLLHRVAAGETGYDAYKTSLTDVHTRMIRRNSGRTLAMGLTIASYMYGLVDGTLNHPGKVNDVKKATTLAMVFPGAGQVYNQTYWKLPVVVGGAAVLLYCVEYNNRVYQRYKLAYTALTDGDDSTIDEWRGQKSSTEIQNVKKLSRRNRDLCIILSGLFYIVQVVDAHATAHMKTYDVSDDLARVTFEPSVGSVHLARFGGSEVHTFGFSLGVTF